MYPVLVPRSHEHDWKPTNLLYRPAPKHLSIVELPSHISFHRWSRLNVATRIGSALIHPELVLPHLLGWNTRLGPANGRQQSANRSLHLSGSLPGKSHTVRL